MYTGTEAKKTRMRLKTPLTCVVLIRRWGDAGLSGGLEAQRCIGWQCKSDPVGIEPVSKYGRESKEQAF